MIAEPGPCSRPALARRLDLDRGGSEKVITLTSAAVDAVKKAMAEESLPEGASLRIEVHSGGCSGMSYRMTFEEGVRSDDRAIEADGLRVLIDPKSEIYLAGAELDYSGGLSGRGFVFRNPNAAKSCGCGKSFAA
jgi:iron-sulfur cluster assembly protein